jgi:type IV pilus assembly protein PilB
VLIVDDTLRRMITDQCLESETRDYAIRQGMITMFDDGLIKVADGLTTFSEVFRSTINQGS